MRSSMTEAPPRQAFAVPDQRLRPEEPNGGPDPDGFASMLQDDMGPVILELPPRALLALATLYAREGGPRLVGSQMVITSRRVWGFMSGGCVEGDIATHGRTALADGRARRLTYGRGSPFFDIRLPCGGRLDLLVEPLEAGDPVVAKLLWPAT